MASFKKTVLLGSRKSFVLTSQSQSSEEKEMDMLITSRSSGKPPDVTEIRAIRDYAKKHGGLKRIQQTVATVTELIALPATMEQGRYADLLKSRLHEMACIIEHAKNHGGMGRLEKEVAIVVEIATLTGGNIDKIKQAIDFLKE